MASKTEKRRPIHREIADEMRKRIATHAYPGAELPRELSLMEEFGVSRHTIRAALQQLVNDGIVERKAGSGTRITERAKGGIWAAGSLGRLIGEFTPDQYLTLSIREAAAREHPDAALLFGLAPEDHVFHILRLLMQKDLPYGVVNMFARVEVARPVPQALLGIQPFITLIEQHAKVRPARVRQVASACSADDQSARQLGVTPGAAVLRLQRTYFDSNGSPFLHVDLMCRPDRYQQVIDFVHEAPAEQG